MHRLYYNMFMKLTPKFGENIKFTKTRRSEIIKYLNYKFKNYKFCLISEIVERNIYSIEFTVEVIVKDSKQDVNKILNPKNLSFKDYEFICNVNHKMKLKLGSLLHD